jgi:serine protease AprX
MHVDGTSFAAPIVCSVIAQMLEANTKLTPATIREVLFNTAKRIEGLPAERQGFGVIRPRKALLKVLKRDVIMRQNASPFVNKEKKSIEFYMQSDCASQISLAGSFNHWAQDVLLLEPGRNGLWKIEIPMLPAGRYKYKFFVDDKMWVEDVDNPYREPDGFSGFNSLLMIE